MVSTWTKNGKFFKHWNGEFGNFFDKWKHLWLVRQGWVCRWRVFFIYCVYCRYIVCSFYLYIIISSLSVRQWLSSFRSSETPPAVSIFCLYLPGTLVNIHIFHVSLYCIMKLQPGPSLVALSFLKPIYVISIDFVCWLISLSLKY